MNGIHPMDQFPPDDPSSPGDSVEVVLEYEGHHSQRGFFGGWCGWLAIVDGVPTPCEEDDAEPIGWREVVP